MNADNCAHCGLPLDDHWLASCPDIDGKRGPITWDEEQCDICHQPIRENDRAHRTAAETAHISCIRQWFHGNFGSEDLS